LIGRPQESFIEMTASDIQRRILDAVDAGFDAQLATTRDFVAIPSTRGAEGPCQDMIGDLLRARGYEVDDWHIDLDELKDLARSNMISPKLEPWSAPTDRRPMPANR
jgi:acetylornithine deacetylase